LAALQENIEFLADMLFSPALRDDQLDYERTSGGITCGFSALKDVAQGATEIGLGLGTYAPAVWVYHGAHLSTVGQFLRATRDFYANATNRACSVTPTDVLQWSGGPSVFPAMTISGSTKHALPSTVAPVRRVRPDVYPYEGGTASLAIERWEEDGPVLEGSYSWSQFLARPGCFVEISGTDLAVENNGLYRLVNVRRAASGGDKAVLTRGGLHRVHVSDASNFTAGERLAWASPPDNTSDGTEVRSNFAYVVYIIDNYLYLSQLTAGEDFPTLDDVAARVNADAAENVGRKAVGNVGFPDQEEDTTSNWSLPVGTLLFNPGEDYAEVLEVLPAGYPVRFTTGALAGQAFVCNPIGFALNPALVFEAGALLEGDYTVDCRTLTTVREQMISQGSSAVRGEFEDPAGPLGISREELSLLKSYLRAIKSGEQLLTVNTNDWYAPTAQVLGAGRWRITVENTTDADITADSLVSPNTTLYITIHPTATGVATTRCRVVSCADNQLVLANVSIIGWNQVARRTVAPIIASAVNADASGFSLSGNLFYVRSIDASPALTSTGGAHGIPYPGLDAAYNNAFSPNDFDRGSGSGRYVEVLSGKPISMLLHPTNDADRPAAQDVLYDTNDEGTGGGCSAVKISQRSTGAAKVIYGYKSFIFEEGASAIDSAFIGSAGSVLTLGGTSHTVRALLSFTNGILKFSDLNTGLGYRIPFTTTNDLVPSALPLALQAPSILGALHGLDLADHDTTTAVDRNFAATGSGLLYTEGSKTPLDFAADRRTSFGVGRTLTFSDATHAEVGGADEVDVTDSSVLFIEYLTANGTPMVQYVGVTSYNHPDIVLDTAFAGYAVDPTVATADWGAVADPLVVAVADHYVTVFGRKYHIEATTLTATANSTQYAVYTVTSNTVALLAAAAPLTTDATQLTLGRVRTTAAVAQIEGFPDQVGRQEHKTELYVGAASADEYASRKTHFDSISDAFKYIEVHAADLQYIGRTWVINVRGSVTETEDYARGVLHPLNVPANGVIIRGAHTNGTAHVSWGTKTSLFCTNGKRGFTLENVTFSWSGSWTSDAGLATGLRSDQGVAIVSNVDYAENSITTVHSLRLLDVRGLNVPSVLYLDALAASTSVVLRDVTATGLKGKAVFVRATVGSTDEQSTFGLDRLLLDNCTFSHSAVDPQAADDDCIYVYGVRDVHVLACRSTNARVSGFRLLQYKQAVVRDSGCIDFNLFDDATTYGIVCSSDLARAYAFVSSTRVAHSSAHSGGGVLLDSAGVVQSSFISNLEVGVKLSATGSRAETNEIRAATTYGVWHHAANTVSRGNRILDTDNAADGIYVEYTAAVPFVTLEVSADDCVVSDNMLTGGSDAIRVYGDRAVVSGNTTYGKNVTIGEPAAGARVTGNILYGDGVYGDLLIYGPNAITSGNTIGEFIIDSTGTGCQSRNDKVRGLTVNSNGTWVEQANVLNVTEIGSSGDNVRVHRCTFRGVDAGVVPGVFFAAAGASGLSFVDNICMGRVEILGVDAVVHNNTLGSFDDGANKTLTVTGGGASIVGNNLFDATGYGTLKIGAGENHVGYNATTARVLGRTATDTFLPADLAQAFVEVIATHTGVYNGAVGNLGYTWTIGYKGTMATVVLGPNVGEYDIEFDSDLFTETGLDLESGRWHADIELRTPASTIVPVAGNEQFTVISQIIAGNTIRLRTVWVPNPASIPAVFGGALYQSLWTSFRLILRGPLPAANNYSYILNPPA
jgi:hypothetical protein